MRNLILIIFILIFFFSGNTRAQPVPVIKFQDLDRYLSDTTDTLYIINFWATWCGPCIQELPAFEKINSGSLKQKVRVLLISLDFRTKLESQLIPFIRKKGIRSTVYLLDEPNYNSWIDRVSPEWSGAIPATIMIKGDVQKKIFFERSFTYEELKTEITKILNP